MAFLPVGSVFTAVLFHHMQKMNICESRKVTPDSEMRSARKQCDSWTMPEEPGRQINKSDCEDVIGLLRISRVLCTLYI